MKALKRVMALGLATVMVAGCFSLVGCSGTAKKASEVANYTSDGKRIIKIGTWYDHYYDWDDTSIYDNASVDPDDEEAVEYAQKQFDNYQAVAEKYNCQIQFTNLTWEGTIESINNSILAGRPDCDIYEVSLTFGIPAVLNGYAANLEEFLPKDSDIFTDQVVMTYIGVDMIDGTYIFKTNNGEDAVANTYMLAYNKTMIDQYGLEDPYELWKNGEWTWDKWKEMLKALTLDTDGDNVTDNYGYSSGWTYLLNGLLMSNGTTIASSKTETLTSPATVEVIDFIYDIYNEDKTAKAWDADNWDANMNAYLDGNIGFWISAAWISNANNDASLNFDINWVPFPTGPSGDASTNAQKSAANESGWIIAQGVKDPEEVYNIFYDWCNWYNFDTEYRDARMNWWHESALTEQNYSVMEFSSSPMVLDLWSSLNLEINWLSVIQGELGASEFAETYKNVVQDALDQVGK